MFNSLLKYLHVIRVVRKYPSLCRTLADDACKGNTRFLNASSGHEDLYFRYVDSLVIILVAGRIPSVHKQKLCPHHAGLPGSTSYLKQMIRIYPGNLGPFFPVNFHYPIMAPLTTKSSSILSLVLLEGGDSVKLNIFSSSTFVTTHDRTCKRPWYCI